MEIPAHIEALRAAGDQMAVAVAGLDPEAPVPPCPEWRVRDLVRHTGGVHRWATGFVRGGTEPVRAELEDVAGGWPADAELAPWLAQGCADLVAALVEAPDDLDCWTFLPAPSPRAMWARRQAHETAIHRADAQRAAGSPLSPLDPAFAADGVDELLTLFVPRRGTGLRADPPVTLRMACADDDAAWLLLLGADGVTTTATVGHEGSGGADCSVTGRAADLYYALWHRAAGDDLAVSGDAAVLDLFADSVHIRWG